MAFDEVLKRRVRMKAAYRCCWCERFGMVEVHHIVPQADNGLDDEENAAPLCPNCHALYGDNPRLRKRIRERRNWWFRVAAKKYPFEYEEVRKSVETVDAELLAVGRDPDAIRKLRQALETYVQEMLNFISPGNARETADLLLNAIPLDTGALLPKAHITMEGFCACEREHCVGRRDRAYCYWSKDLSQWVIEKHLYWRCYDEIVECSKCGHQHKRGHIGKKGICGNASL